MSTFIAANKIWGKTKKKSGENVNEEEMETWRKRRRADKQTSEQDMTSNGKDLEIKNGSIIISIIPQRSDRHCLTVTSVNDDCNWFLSHTELVLSVGLVELNWNDDQKKTVQSHATQSRESIDHPGCVISDDDEETAVHW